METCTFLRVGLEALLLIVVGFILFEAVNTAYPLLDKLAFFVMGVAYTLACSFYMPERIKTIDEKSKRNVC